MELDTAATGLVVVVVVVQSSQVPVVVVLAAGLVVVVVVVGDFESASGVMVDWEEDREKVLASGAR